jgi:hypothetical protein
MAEKWIQKAVKRPGRIKRALGVPEDKPIPAGKMSRLRAMAKKKGSLGSAARLALRFKKGI